MLNNYDHSFVQKNGRQIFVQTKIDRDFGTRLHNRILRAWKPPSFFYHLQPGGHLAAVRAHLPNNFFLYADLERFYDSISRTRIHRALKKIGWSQSDAWKTACRSTVKKSKAKEAYCLPFGFVQSPILASVVLATSAFGAAIQMISAKGIAISIYMDDVLVSSDDVNELIAVQNELMVAVATAGFSFGSAKKSDPSPSADLFNLNISNNSMALTSRRIAEFVDALKTANPARREGILSYVKNINKNQYDIVSKI